MTNLRKLSDLNSTLTNDGIKNLNLTYLCCANPNITDINHLANLSTLYLMNGCDIDDAGIKNLNLTKLNCFSTNKITNVNHMSKLRILDASQCKIGDDGIKDLKLTLLISQWNKNIKKDYNSSTCCHTHVLDDPYLFD